jgi:hypothetical protein
LRQPLFALPSAKESISTPALLPKSKLALRHFDREQANWLARCLLLPRAVLLKIKASCWTDEKILPNVHGLFSDAEVSNEHELREHSTWPFEETARIGL